VIFQCVRRTENHKAIDRGTLAGDPRPAQATLAALELRQPTGKPLRVPPI